MDFDSARSQFRRTLTELRDSLEKNIRTDWDRSKIEALQLWRTVSEVAHEAARLSDDVAEEIRVDARLAMRSLQAHLVSDGFEARLDELIRKAGGAERFETATTIEDELWFARIHASLFEDPLEFADRKRTTDRDLAERRARIGRKLTYLFRHYRDDVVKAARSGWSASA